MMNRGRFFGAILTLLVGAVAAFAVEGPTLELGKALFESSQLGTAKRSCQSCHPAGTDLEQANKRSDTALKQRINRCIRNAQGGAVLDTGSQEMDALLNYIKTFSDK